MTAVIFKKKKIELDIEAEYDELSQSIQKRFQAADLDQEVVEAAIGWAREQRT